MKKKGLALPLFMLWCLADDADDASSAYDATLVADLFDGWSDFHRIERRKSELTLSKYNATL